MMKAIVTGASGLVGHAVAEAMAERGFEVTALYHNRKAKWSPKIEDLCVNLSQTEACDRLILDRFPDIIVNAAAASSPAAVDKDANLAEKLNVALPRRLAELANHVGARIIHFSTDMVFDGSSAPYRSTDMPCPGSLYGQLKLMAEREVLAKGGTHATVLRIPIVTGDSPSGNRSLHEKLFQEWAAGRRVKLFTDEIRQPISAVALGELVTELCQRPNLHGLFHWAGEDVMSRYEIGKRICQHFELPEDLIEAAESPGGRPSDLRMELHPLLGKVRVRPPSFNEQLTGMNVPPLCRAWYASLRGLPDGAVGKPVRLIKGRDF